MKSVLFVNHKEHACGVQQFGKRVASIFNDNTLKFKGYYVECSNVKEFMEAMNLYRPEIVIYNYLNETMSWFNIQVFEYIKTFGVVQGLVVHNKGYSHFFDFYLHQIPDYPENGNNYPLLRPLFTYTKTPIKEEGVIKIGTFGFGLKNKQCEKICKLVNEQFGNEKVVLHLHLTLAHFAYKPQELEEVKAACSKEITKPNISLKFSHNFLAEEDLLDFLAGNDLNVYLYDYFDNYCGISGPPDYMLSVKKPMALNKSNMFAHLNHIQPSICIEDTTLKEILANGFAPLQPYYDAWSHKNYTEHLEKTLEKVCP